MATATNPDALISILGSSYCQPIADLVEQWQKRPRHPPTKVMSAFYEYGYSASVILLLVAMFESYVVRLRFEQGKKVPPDTRIALDVVRAIFPRLRHMKSIVDVYVLRDTIFHNHLWEIQFSYGRSPSMVMHSAARHPAFGDNKYKVRVNTATRQTRALRLNIVPTRVDRFDVKKVFDTIWKTLLIFETKKVLQCNLSTTRVQFAGKVILFSDVIAQLTNRAKLKSKG
jgi:hypothetical protein